MTRTHRTIRSLLRATVAAGALVVPLAANAADLCIEFPSFLPNVEELFRPLFLENFRIPRKGTCRTVSGVASVTLGPSVVYGAACTSSSGTQLNIALSRRVMPNLFGSGDGSAVEYNLAFQLPSLEGFGNVFTGGGPGIAGHANITAVSCDNRLIP